MEFILLLFAIGAIIGYFNLFPLKYEYLRVKLVEIDFYLLLFTLGIKIAIEPKVINNLANLGLQAIIFALVTSFSGIIVTYAFLELGKKALLTSKNMNIAKTVAKDEPALNLNTNEAIDLKGCLIPLIAVCTGCISGILIYNFKLDLNLDYDLLIAIFLNIMLLGVGLDIGRSRESLTFIRGNFLLAIIIPLGALLGAMLGGFFMFLLFKLPLPFSLATAAGSGFYSITGPLVADTLGVEYGALAFLTNFLRELLTILLIPFIALKFNNLSLITSGGATAMDSTLPVITRALGSNAAIIAVIQGIILTIIVPILVPILVSL